MAEEFKLSMIRDYFGIPNAEFIKTMKEMEKSDVEEIKQLVAKELGVVIKK